MDFFSAQEQSRRTTRFLVAMFALATISIVVAVTAVAAILLRLYGSQYNYLTGTAQPWRAWITDNWPELGAAALVTLAFITLASLYRMSRLAGGGSFVARQLGGTEVTPDVNDPLRRRLLNIVEEMAIASGVPVPEVFVLEQEPAINAFAAGYSHSDAAVAVTRGALEQLDRAELQGVIAHEFSHILNGDMRLNIRLMGLLYGIVILSLVGRWLLRGARYTGRGRNSGGAAAALMLGLALTLIGSMGFFFGRLIKAGVSRQREFLADASAVQFTRDPSGIAGALKKIGGFGGVLTSADSEEISHMLFSKGAAGFSGLFATHPPLKDRIKRLDPSFNAEQFPQPTDAFMPHMDEEALIAPLAAEVKVKEKQLTADQLVEAVGQVGPAQISFAAQIHRSLPEELRAAAHSRDDSLLLAVSLALHKEPGIRAGQLEILRQQLGQLRSRRCERFAATLQTLGPQYRLPVLEMAFPSLKDRPRAQLDYLLSLIEKLLRNDGQLELFEYTLLRVMGGYLNDAQHPARIRYRRRNRRAAVAAATEVLALVAHSGHATPQQAEAGFQRGLIELGTRGATSLSKEPMDLDSFDAALNQLAALNLRGRRAMLRAVYATVAHDGRINVAEQELLRAVSAVLRCPLPPLASADVADSPVSLL